MKYSMIYPKTSRESWGNGAPQPKILKTDHSSYVKATLYDDEDHKANQKQYTHTHHSHTHTLAHIHIYIIYIYYIYILYIIYIYIHTYIYIYIHIYIIYILYFYLFIQFLCKPPLNMFKSLRKGPKWLRILKIEHSL